MRCRILLVGFGNVGREFARLLLERRSELAKVHGRSAEYIRRARAEVVIEITPLRIAPRQIGVDHIVAALSSGKHVITANKGPVVYHYQRLRRLAREHGVGFRYEGTVMDGAPVFNLVQEP